MESKIYETIDDEVVVTDTKAGGTVESPKSGERLVDYRNVTIERAARVVLKGVTFGVSEGEFCYLTGKVGGAKGPTGTAPLAGHRGPGLPAAAGPFGGRKPALRAEGHRLEVEGGDRGPHRGGDEGRGDGKQGLQDAS